MEKKVIAMEEKVADIEKKLSEVLIQASEVEEEFQEQKNHVDGLSKSIVHSIIKQEEAGSHLASIHQKVEVTCQDEAQAISNTKAKIAKFRKNF